jgi:DNA-binding XRE family transcriptional regulator
MMHNLPQEIVNDDQALREFLKTDWILSTMLNLEKVRKDAHYSQKDLAQRLGTTQSVISRTESDSTGAISVRRYVEWLFACGVVPMELAVEPWPKVKAQAYMTNNSSPIWGENSALNSNSMPVEDSRSSQTVDNPNSNAASNSPVVAA